MFLFSFLPPSPDLPPHPTLVSEIRCYTTIFSLDGSDWKLVDYAHDRIDPKVGACLACLSNSKLDEQLVVDGQSKPEGER